MWIHSKSAITHPVITKVIRATFLFFLACQSAQTEEQAAELPRVSDQKDVELEPKLNEVKPLQDTFEETIKKYSKGESIKIDLIKTAKLKMLNRVDEYKGLAFLKGKSKLRIEFFEPVKSIAVLNGKRAWVIEYPPKDVDDKVRVSKFTLSKTPGQSQLLITSILSSGNLLKTFKVEKNSDTHGRLTYVLTPKKPMEEIKSIGLVIDQKKKEISEIKYLDPIDNETTFKFTKTSFGMELAPSLFEYSVPKGAEVNEF